MNLPATQNVNDMYNIPDSETGKRSTLKINHDAGVWEADGLQLTNKVELILVKGVFIRTMMNDDMDNPEVLCKSLDFIEGKGEPSGVCMQCENQKFIEKQKPACAKCLEMYFAIWNGATGQFDEYVQYARSTAYTVARKLINNLHKADAVPFAFKVELSLQAKSYGNKTYYVPIYTVKDQLPEKQVDAIFNEVLTPLNSEIAKRISDWQSDSDVEIDREDVGFPSGEFEAEDDEFI